MKSEIDIYKTRLTEKVEDNYIVHQERINGNIIGNQMCLNKLGHLEDLEEQGLLIKLPCKVGIRYIQLSIRLIHLILNRKTLWQLNFGTKIML